MEKLVNNWLGIDGYHCFACDPNHQHGLHMEFMEDGDDIVSYWKPTGEHQSWLNTLHGGIQATLIDEICGWVLTRKLQTTGVTAKMEIRYRKPVKTVDEVLTIRARIQSQQRNLLTITATISNSEGQVCTEGTCVYFITNNPQTALGMEFPHCYTESELNEEKI